jgi:hypothetical protein
VVPRRTLSLPREAWNCRHWKRRNQDIIEISLHWWNWMLQLNYVIVENTEKWLLIHTQKVAESFSLEICEANSSVISNKSSLPLFLRTDAAPWAGASILIGFHQVVLEAFWDLGFCNAMTKWKRLPYEYRFVEIDWPEMKECCSHVSSAGWIL